DGIRDFHVTGVQTCALPIWRLLGKRSKFQSTLGAVGLLVVFLIITGLGASIVRAALVSGLSLLAWYYGRKFRPLLLITLAAAARSEERRVGKVCMYECAID